MRVERPRGDAGMGLPELLVSMLVGSVVLTAVATVFTGTLRTSNDTTASISGGAEVRDATDLIARRLRVTVLPIGATSAFDVAKPSDVVFYASIVPRGTTTDPLPTKVEYVIDAAARCLREKLTPPSATLPTTWPATGTTSRCIAYGLFNGPGAPSLFSFYDTGIATAPLPSDATGDVLVKAAIDSVGIAPSVVARTGSRQGPSVLNTRVTMTNTNGGL